MQDKEFAQKIANQLYAVRGVQDVGVDIEQRKLFVQSTNGSVLSPWALATAAERAQGQPIAVAGPIRRIDDRTIGSRRPDHRSQTNILSNSRRSSMRLVSLLALVSLLSMALTGCGSSSSAEMNSQSVTPISIDGSKYLLAEEPDGAIGVIETRKTAANGEPIVVVGRIGGATNPWIEGRAAFMLLDASMMIVADGTESTEGEICMDECCATERAGSTTLVKVVDENGKVLAVDARNS